MVIVFFLYIFLSLMNRSCCSGVSCNNYSNSLDLLTIIVSDLFLFLHNFCIGFSFFPLVTVFSSDYIKVEHNKS